METKDVYVDDHPGPTRLPESTLRSLPAAALSTADSGWLSQILSLGWDCRPLGLPRDIAGLNTGALVIEIDSDTPDKLRTAGTYVPMRIVHAHADGRAAA